MLNDNKNNTSIHLILSPDLLLGRLAVRSHLLQFIVQAHRASRIIENIILSVQQWLDQSVEVRVFLEWWVRCLYLGKVGLVN